MGRRSPILGYNHNVRYRGIVFHVQTEDSGLINPHIFSHLFHGGVIVSTRKLVYDPDADDGVVKSLMQAQHKAVMKELRRGLFDDKIDRNLVGTPGLLPRGRDLANDSDPGSPVAEAIATEQSGGEPMIELEADEPSEGILVPVPQEAYAPVLEMTVGEDEPSQPEIELLMQPGQTPPGVPAVEVAHDPTLKTNPPQMDAPRARAVDSVPPFPPPPSEPRVGSSPAMRRASTPPPISSASLPPIPPRGPTPGSTVRGAAPVPKQSMTPPPVVIRPSTDGVRTRDDVSAAFDTIQTPDEAAEIHSPAMASAPGPRGAPARPTEERTDGSYSAQRPERGLREEFRTGKLPPITAVPEPIRDRSGGIVEQPAALRGGPPSRQPAPTPGVVSRPQISVPDIKPTAARTPSPGVPASRTSTPGSGGVPATPRTSTPPTGPVPAGRSPMPPGRLTPGGGVTVPRTRSPTAPRYSPRPPGQPPPAAAQQRQARPQGSGGVVMSRPAVIVGGRSQPSGPAAPPAEPRTTTAPRVRRAREEGGRGMFGQDLISEKSLDEVILAYLSEE